MADVRDQERELTKDRLVEVTMQLLDREGNHALRLAEVAAESGVAVSTIYAHFRDRTDLVATARLRQFRAHAHESIAAVDVALDAGADPESFTAAAMWPSLLDPEESSGKVRRWDRIEAIADSRHIPELATQLEAMQSDLNERVTELIEHAQQLGLVSDELDAAAVAMLSQVMRLGLALWDISGDTRPDPEAWAKVVTTVFQALLADGVDADSVPI
jgi:AcrR family transcriptional regulator